MQQGEQCHMLRVPVPGEEHVHANLRNVEVTPVKQLVLRCFRRGFEARVDHNRHPVPKANQDVSDEIQPTFTFPLRGLRCTLIRPTFAQPTTRQCKEPRSNSPFRLAITVIGQSSLVDTGNCHRVSIVVFWPSSGALTFL
jgi:hypothetical protein